MLKRGICLLLLFISLTAASQTYYIVRHAEKAAVDGNPNMSATDPPLSETGKRRASDLLEALKNENIGFIFSTNTIRTRTTAEPLSKLSGVAIQTYGPRPDSAFVQMLKGLKGKVLVVGHSNTVDDIVNMLCGEQKFTDLADSEYDNLFVVTIKNGQAVFERRKFGKVLQ